MDLRHEFTVPASIDQTWSAFNDIESVAVCFPGAKVTSVEGDTFTGTVKVKLGPIALIYNGTGTFIEKDESQHRMVIDAKGKDKRGNGTAGAHVTATMTEQGTSTHVEVLTDLNITGKPAQFGRGVMEDVSNKLLGQFTDCLEQKVGDSGTADEATVADDASAATADEPDAERRMNNLRGAPAAWAGHARRAGERPGTRPGRHRPAGAREGLLEAGRGRAARALGAAIADRSPSLRVVVSRRVSSVHSLRSLLDHHRAGSLLNHRGSGLTRGWVRGNPGIAGYRVAGTFDP